MFDFLRRLGSFNICNKLLLMVYKSVMASVLFYAVICWGGNTRKRGAGRLVRQTGCVVGTELESLTLVAVKRTPNRLLSIMDNDHQPLHSTFSKQKSMFNSRLLSLTCSTDRLRRSYISYGIKYLSINQSINQSINLSIYLSGSDRKVSEYTVHHCQGCFGSKRGIYPFNTILRRWS